VQRTGSKGESSSPHRGPLFSGLPPANSPRLPPAGQGRGRCQTPFAVNWPLQQNGDISSTDRCGVGRDLTSVCDARLWMTLALIEALLSLGPATPLGTLWFFSARRRDFAPEQTNLAEIVAGRIASDLEREMLLSEGVEWSKRREVKNPRLVD